MMKRRNAGGKNMQPGGKEQAQRRAEGVPLRTGILKGLLLYGLVPILCLLLLAQPIRDAVTRGRNTAAFLILLAALAAVVFNWFVYASVRRKFPPLPVLSHGAGCLLLVTLVEYFALPPTDTLASTLSVVAGCLLLAILFLLCFWLAARRSRPAHVFAVGLGIVIGVLAFFMAFRVFRDIESRNVTADTWITGLILLALIPAAMARRIRAGYRLAALRRRTSGLAEGRIVQMIGETSLDMDEEYVTSYHARVEYAVGGVSYETRAPIRKLTLRWFGRKSFVGMKIPVHYNPEDPADAYADRIDRRFFDRQPPRGPEETNEA